MRMATEGKVPIEYDYKFWSPKIEASKKIDII